MAIAFGTEGWRAVIAEEFTFENVRLVTQAIADHYLADRAGTVLAGERSESRSWDEGVSRRAGGATAAPRLAMAVGYDTRFLSDRFARAVCEVLAGNGIRCVLADRAVPTPAVSRQVVARRLVAGVVVTASHNPPVYNGLKVKEAFGGSATAETVQSIEKRIGRRPPARMSFERAVRQGLVQESNFLEAFLKGIRSYVNLRAIRQSRFKVLIDPMHGAADGLMQQLLEGGKLRVKTLHAEPDPLFGGHAPEPIPRYLTDLAREVRQGRWDVGLATDGDADRIGAVMPNGAFLNPGQVLCILLEHLITTRKWKGAVVKTVSNTSMIDRMAQGLGLKLLEVPVGFKHITKLMLEDEVLIGGEESGGIGLQGYLPERDGMLMGLMVLEAMAMQGRGVQEILRRLEKRFGRWHYARRDLTLSHELAAKAFRRLATHPPARVAGVPVAQVKTLDGVKLIDRQDNWLLFRRSGTEPIVRVYAEAGASKHVNRLLDFGVQLVQAS